MASAAPVLTKAGPVVKASKFIRPFPELFAGEISSSTKKEKGKHAQSELQAELVLPGPASWVKVYFKGFKYFRRLKLILIISGFASSWFYETFNEFY